jgi:type II secretory ATPase GspE/PulE/Tfp pilus assembly ATPase PilB-like protein
MMQNIGMKDFLADHIKLYTWKWCKQCNGTWYKGRMGIYEVINMDDTIRQLVKTGWTPEEIIKVAKQNGMIMMKEDGILKALRGFTTIQEVLRVV